MASRGSLTILFHLISHTILPPNFCAEMCGNVRNRAEMCGNVRKCAELCGIVHDCANFSSVENLFFL
jgi:hypothetical protein